MELGTLPHVTGSCSAVKHATPGASCCPAVGTASAREEFTCIGDGRKELGAGDSFF